MMKAAFEQRVLNEKIVDTKNYRYVFADCGDHAEIQRLPLEYLDTTKALSNWETVKRL